MNAKASTHPLAVRFTGEERQFLKDFQEKLANSMPGATLSDVVKVLVEAGRKALQPPAADPAMFLSALRGLDPTWNGRKPEMHKPPEIQTQSGRSAVDLVMARRKKA